MPRRPNLIPTARMTARIPENLMVRLNLLLFSETEGRVPFAAYQEFFTARLLEFFEDKPLDLGPFLGTLPGEAVVRGKTATIYQLAKHLKEKA